MNKNDQHRYRLMCFLFRWYEVEWNWWGWCGGLFIFFSFLFPW